MIFIKCSKMFQRCFNELPESFRDVYEMWQRFRQNCFRDFWRWFRAVSEMFQRLFRKWSVVRQGYSICFCQACLRKVSHIFRNVSEMLQMFQIRFRTCSIIFQRLFICVFKQFPKGYSERFSDIFRDWSYEYCFTLTL